MSLRTPFFSLIRASSSSAVTELPGSFWAMMIFHNVTASKKAAQMRADFVTNVDHELRSPLSALLGLLSSLE
jgi:signal transduction histidine kinase